MRLRISPPSQSTTSSLASLSSADEDGGVWDLTSDPPVTRSQSARLSRSHSYNNFADDESSDASTTTGFLDGCGTQGSFPSTDRIRVRWASPAKTRQAPETADGRRRVGIREVKGDMLCSVLAKHKGKAREGGPDGLLVKLDYTATCKGVWFPGVATLLGMDLGLEAHDCDITWAPGHEPKWTVTGSAGFMGFAMGGPTQPGSRQPVSRQSSAEYPPSIYVLPSSPNGKPSKGTSPIPMRTVNGSAASTSSNSLLRASLPVHNVAEYSFESSSVSTPSGTVSSLPSLSGPSSPERTRHRRSSSKHRGREGTDTDIDDQPADVRPPKAPITIHLNMNELSPPPKNVFTFSVSGTVLVYPRRSAMTPDSRRSSPASSEDDRDDEPISLPTFRIFSTGQETTSTIVRNDAQQASVHVFTRNEKHGTNARKAVLMKGNQATCGNADVRVVFSPISSSQLRGRRPGDDSSDLSFDRTGLSLGLRSTSRLRDASMMSTAKLQPRRDGPLMIPYVNAKITSLLAEGRDFRSGYAVEITLPAPSDTDSEWLEFGLALPGRVSVSKPDGASASDTQSRDAPRVEIASASVEGVPVRCQTSATVKPPAGMGLGLSFEEMSGKEWISWVSVHVGHIGGGNVRIIYLVKGDNQSIDGNSDAEKKAEERRHSDLPLDILLPSFALPVGQLQVDIQLQEGEAARWFAWHNHLIVHSGFKLSSVDTNLVHQQASPHGLRLIHYALAEFHYPQLSAQVTPIVSAPAKSSPRSHDLWLIAKVVGALVIFAFVFSLVADLRRATSELDTLRQAAHLDAALSAASSLDGLILTETITVTSITTTTLPPGDAKKRWFGPGSDQSAAPTSIISNTPNPKPLPASASQASQELPTSYSAPPTTTQAPEVKAIQPSTRLMTDNEPYSLILSHYFSRVWQWQRLLPDKFGDAEVAQAAKEAAHVVIGGMGVVWQIFRKIIHYPLDPP